jgi:hypothetical protein
MPPIARGKNLTGPAGRGKKNLKPSGNFSLPPSGSGRRPAGTKKGVRFLFRLSAAEVEEEILPPRNMDNKVEELFQLTLVELYLIACV